MVRLNLGCYPQFGGKLIVFFLGGGASHDLERPVPPPTPGPSVEPPLAGKCAIGRVRPFTLCHLTHLTIGLYTHAKYLYTLHVYGT